MIISILLSHSGNYKRKAKIKNHYNKTTHDAYILCLWSLLNICTCKLQNDISFHQSTMKNLKCNPIIHTNDPPTPNTPCRPQNITISYEKRECP